MARLAPPSGLLVEIKWALSMAAALPKSLLADMSEQQQILAVQLSKTAADAERLQLEEAAAPVDHGAGWRAARSQHLENGGGRSSSRRAAKERPLAERAFRAWSASGFCFAVDGRRWVEWTFSRVRT